MSMHLEPQSRKVFELVASAVDQIKAFQQERSLSKLDKAQEDLSEALKEEPGYVDAVFYSGMVNDLTGKAINAIPQFEQVLAANPPFLDQVEYNLGVAHYHRYSPGHLDQAITHFEAAIKATRDPALRVLARAGLAQTYGMKVLQRNTIHARESFDLSKKESKTAEKEVRRLRGTPEAIIDEVKWTLHNARAIAAMFYSDHERDAGRRQKLLEQALKDVAEADKRSPKNWAVQCNFGSIYMRLYTVYKAQGSNELAMNAYEKALQHLRKVVESIRPNYGFALYEIGRVYRLGAKFDQAVDSFDRALKISYDVRDVSDETINREKQRAESRDTQFP